LKNNFFSPRYWPTWLGLALLRIISSLPWPVVAVISDGLGYVIFKLYKSRRLISEKNVRVCFPEFTDEKVTQIALRSFQLSTQAMFLTGIAWWASEKRYRKLIQCDTSEIDKHLESGSNIIVLTAHFLGVEAAGVFLSMDRPFMDIYQYAKNPLIQHYVTTKRGRFGGQLIERKEPLRKMMKLIRNQVPLLYLPDQDAGRKGRFVPFFGVQASTFDTLGKMTTLTKAVVLPCTIQILDKGRGVKVQFHTPLTDFPSGDDLKDTLRQNEVMEQLISEMPEQYLWAHKRFKTRPEGEKAF